MFKWTRKAMVLVQHGEQADAETKKHINDIKEACNMLMKTLTYWYKTFSDHSSNTIAVHEDLANLYPANEPYSVAVAMLNNSAKVFQEAPAAVEELKKAFEAPIADLLAKLHDLANKAHDRQIARAEIKYYQEKVAALANDAHSATDAKKQSKAESNNAKLQENKTIFQKLDEELTTEVHKLDSEIAHLTHAAIGKFMQLQAKKAHSLLEIYSSALDSIGVAPSAAAAAGGSAAGGAEGAPSASE